MLVGGWVVLVFVANPIGAFPLDDDWSFSKAVQTLVEHGRLEFTWWTSMTLAAQVLWGALFCLPFGFSFLALRLSTVVLGALGIIAAYALLREFRVDRTMSLFGAALVGLNPIYFCLSLTFMTDVPFVALSMLSLLFFVRALRTEAPADLLAAFSLATGAVFIRQPGIFIPIAFAIVYGLKHGLNRGTLVRAILPTAGLIGAIWIYPAILRATTGLPSEYITLHRILDGIRGSESSDLLKTPKAIGDRLLTELFYLGLFLLPSSILVVRHFWQRLGSTTSGRRSFITVAALVAALVGVVLWQGRLMPLSGNILFDFGLGPPLLRDTYLLHLRHLPTAPHAFWVVITALSVIGSVVILLSLWSLRPRSQASGGHGFLGWQTRMVLIVAAAYAVATAVTTASPQFSFFDRYVVFLLLPVLVLTCRVLPSRRSGGMAFSLAVGVVLLYGAFAVGGTHDYLSWNRARWEAVGDLTRNGVSPRLVDGGFEYNAWFGYDPDHPKNRPLWRRESEYVVAFGPLRGHVTVRSYSYRRWVPFEHDDVLILRRARER
jgi:hypothetical protein